MAHEKKRMSDLEKQAKMTALRGAHSQATDLMKKSLGDIKDSSYLKKHVAEMSKDSGIDFKGDSDHIEDPEREGNVIGRHISDQNDPVETSADLSSYDIDLKIQKLLKEKHSRK